MAVLKQIRKLNDPARPGGTSAAQRGHGRAPGARRKGTGKPQRFCGLPLTPQPPVITRSLDPAPPHAIISRTPGARRALSPHAQSARRPYLARPPRPTSG
jgi:hypothetical protein